MPRGQVPPPKPKRTFTTQARLKNIKDPGIDQEGFENKDEKNKCKTN